MPNRPDRRPQIGPEERDPRSRLIYLTAEDAQEPTFLWKPYLPEDELCTLAGPKGVGKTWVSLNLAARVTRGEGFPGDEEPRPPKNVIYGSREGHLRKAIVHRCVALGVDMGRMGFMERGWDLGDLPGLEASILEREAVLVILDPLTSYFLGDAAYSGSKARRMTEILTEIANHTHCCILGILHLTKDHKHARGSGEIENVARVNLQMGHCQRDGRELFVQTKNGLAAAGVSRHYEILPDHRGVEWQGEAQDEGIEDLGPRKRRDGAQQLATIFLQVTLAEGEMLARVVLYRAQRQGINEKTLRRAAAGLGISQEAGTIYRKGCREWWWRLPTTAAGPEVPSERNPSGPEPSNPDLGVPPASPKGPGQLSMCPPVLLLPAWTATAESARASSGGQVPSNGEDSSGEPKLKMVVGCLEPTPPDEEDDGTGLSDEEAMYPLNDYSTSKEDQ